jgi:hypothetical protein
MSAAKVRGIGSNEMKIGLKCKELGVIETGHIKAMKLCICYLQKKFLCVLFVKSFVVDVWVEINLNSSDIVEKFNSLFVLYQNSPFALCIEVQSAMALIQF